MVRASGTRKTAALVLLAAACNTAALRPGSNTDAAATPPGYFACSASGAQTKVVLIGNCDVDRRLVFVVTLVHFPDAPAVPGLTLPADWALATTTAVADNMGRCPSRGQSGPHADVTGTIEWARAGDASVFPSAVNVDVTLSFEPGDAAVPATESIVARNLDVVSGCPP